MPGKNFNKNYDTMGRLRMNQGDMRERIQTGMILSQLHRLINGDIKMSTQQVTAAVALLKKAMPDLRQVEVKGDIGVAPIEDARDVAIARIRMIAEKLGCALIPKPNGSGDNAGIASD